MAKRMPSPARVPALLPRLSRARVLTSGSRTAYCTRSRNRARILFAVSSRNSFARAAENFWPRRVMYASISADGIRSHTSGVRNSLPSSAVAGRLRIMSHNSASMSYKFRRRCSALAKLSRLLLRICARSCAMLRQTFFLLLSVHQDSPFSRKKRFISQLILPGVSVPLKRVLMLPIRESK